MSGRIRWRRSWWETNPQVQLTLLEQTATHAPVALRLRHITKPFGPTTALDDVSMTIDASEVRALIGRNGAGKSTLVSIITAC